MTSKRTTLIERMATALFDYATTRELATWDGARPGLNIPTTPEVLFRNCGAFRQWAIHAHDKIVGFSMDGYTHKRKGRTGAVFVLIGNGEFIFPANDSCGHHSLALKTSGNAKLVCVTNENESAWNNNLVRMCDVLETAKRQLDRGITDYDEQAQTMRSANRREELDGARAAIAKATGETKPPDPRTLRPCPLGKEMR